MADFNSWLQSLTNFNSDQQVPSTMQQMSQQASPFPMGSPPPPPDNNPVPYFLRPTQPNQPKVVPPPPPKPSPYTTQPTTQPLGTLPQEMVPQQPSLTDPTTGQINPMEVYNRILAIKPRDNSAMMAQLNQGEENRQNQQAQHVAEIQKLKEGLAKYSSTPSGIDLRPLAAVVGNWGSGNPMLFKAAEGMAPESAAQKMENIQNMQAKIADMQGKIPDQELDALKNKLAQMGYMDERQTKLEMAKIMAEANLAKAGQMGGRNATAQDRLASQAVKSIHDDEIVKQATKQSNQMAIDRHTLATAKEIPPQMLNEVQKGIANAISGGRAASVSDTEAMKMQNLQTEYAEFMQKVSSGVVDVNAPEMKQYLSHVIERLDEGYKNIAYARALQKTKGGMKAYAHTPNALAAMQEAAESYNPAKAHSAVLAPQDQEAIDWAKQNRGNPDAESILKLHGVQ